MEASDVANLKEGDVFEIINGDKVHTMIPRCIKYSNTEGDWTLEEGVVEVSGMFTYLAGKYVVYKTTMEGGGTCYRDVISDAHCVYAENLASGVKIRFFQRDDFTTCIKDRPAIGRAELRWVYVDKEKKHGKHD
jgi:hypothetical protein